MREWGSGWWQGVGGIPDRDKKFYSSGAAESMNGGRKASADLARRAIAVAIAVAMGPGRNAPTCESYV